MNEQDAYLPGTSDSSAGAFFMSKSQKNDIFLPKLLLNNKTLFSIYTNFRKWSDLYGIFGNYWFTEVCP